MKKIKDPDSVSQFSVVVIIWAKKKNVGSEYTKETLQSWRHVVGTKAQISKVNNHE